jgi:hypothetical protein
MAKILGTGDRRVSVQVLTQEGTIVGVVFASSGQRLQDLMNDSREFLPVEINDHDQRLVKIINKRYIYSILELNNDQAELAKNSGRPNR